MQGSAVRIALVCEDDAHYFLATVLTDRVIVHEAATRGASWVEDYLESVRSYEGPASGEDDYYSMPRAKQVAEELGRTVSVGGRPIKLRGFIDGHRLDPEAGFWRRVLLFFAAQRPAPDLVLIMKDTDGDGARLGGLRQALSLLRDVLPVIVAAPHQDAEAWFMAGFVAESERERTALAACVRSLLFDPCEEPHRLTAQPNEAATDAKRVLRRVAFGEDRSRPPTREELPALCERTLNDLARLRRRGGGCGLVAFLDQVKEVVVPRVIPGRRW